LGCINIHGSLLPRHRGAAPVQWAILEGDRQTGITIMQMDEGMDTGDILLSAAIDIPKKETAGSLFKRLADLGAATLQTALIKLAQGELAPTKQDNSLATKAPPLQKEMGNIDWNLPAEKLDCLIRGLDPWPSAYTFLDGMRYRLFSPEVVHKDGDEPAGTILSATQNGIVVATGNQSLLVAELQPEGKKRLTAASFLCGHSFPSGGRFTNG
ncbi:MAG: methionyl-tRNA formyltransferase, partial [Desulfopila sp.]|nr:methionyl-tRNA formyltransferase [Desulfopila sp.]